MDAGDAGAAGYEDFAGDDSARFTAHPKIDPETGEMVFFGYSAGGFRQGGALWRRRQDRQGDPPAKFRGAVRRMVHDFMVTREPRAVPGPAADRQPGARDERQARFRVGAGQGRHVGVMARDAHGRDIRWFETDPCYVFHPMNACEEGDKIFADVMEYPAAPLFPDADGFAASADATAHLTRWTFDLAANSDRFARNRLDDLAGEFPRSTNASPACRIATAITRRAASAMYRAVDTPSRISISRPASAAPTQLPANDVRAEPVFVPRGANAAEGDGWLLAAGLSRRRKPQRPRVLDATALARGRSRPPNCRTRAVRLPRQLASGLGILWRIGHEYFSRPDAVHRVFSADAMVDAVSGAGGGDHPVGDPEGRLALRGGTVKILELGSLILFGALTVYTLALHPLWSIAGVKLAVHGGLAIAWISLAIRHPFTLQYAKETVPEQFWREPLFIRVNDRITGVWAADSSSPAPATRRRSICPRSRSAPWSRFRSPRWSSRSVHIVVSSAGAPGPLRRRRGDKLRRGNMSLPSLLQGHLRLPVIGAPMFIVSVPRTGDRAMPGGHRRGLSGLECAARGKLEDWIVADQGGSAAYQAAHPDGQGRALRGQSDRPRARTIGWTHDVEICVQPQVPITSPACARPPKW